MSSDPTPSSGAGAPDWTAGSEAVLYERCPQCSHLAYLRRGFCPACGAFPVDTLKSAGEGTVYAATVVVRAPSPAWKALAPYPLVLIDLDEGFRMMAHGVPGLQIGDRVRIGWHRADDKLLPRAERP